MCFTPLIEIKHSSVSPRWNFCAYIHLIRGRFWLHLWTVKNLNEQRVSWRYLTKMWKNSKMRSQFAATLRRWTDGRSLFRRTARCWACPFVVYNASAVTRKAGHMLSEKSQRTQNGTMFVDLDWPLNAPRRLSVSAELLVHITQPTAFRYVEEKCIGR